MGARERSQGPSGPRKSSKQGNSSRSAKPTKNLGKRQAASELPRPAKFQAKDGASKGARFANKPVRSTGGKPAYAGAPKSGDDSQAPQTKKQRKELRHAKLTATKKNFSLILAAVQQWEKARPKATSEQERQKLVADLIAKVKGKVMELANHHSASRVIQFCLKHGSAKDKQTVMGEIKPKLVDLARSKYGHYLARKLINIAAKTEVAGLVKLFRGQVVSLSRHPYGADVLMDLYDVASSQERNAMRAEFYGREFALFDGVVTQAANISAPQQLLEGASGSKRKAIFQHMYKSLMPVLEKALLHPPMIHRLIRDFLLSAPTSIVEDAIDTLCQTGGEVFKMVHTHEGATAVCMLVAYGSAKDRRHLLKGMKGYVKDISCNEWGHATVCTAVSCVDDTTLLKKIVIQELQAALSEIAEHKHGCKVLLQLLSPDNPRYLPPHVLSMLHPPTRTTTTRQSSAAAEAAGAQLHAEADFKAEDMDEEGDGAFGGLNKVGPNKRRKGNTQTTVQVIEGDEDEDDEDEGDMEGWTVVGDFDEDAIDEDGDEDEEEGGSGKIKVGKKQSGKMQMFDEDEDEDEEEDEEDGEDEEEEEASGKKQGSKGKIGKKQAGKSQMFEDEDADEDEGEKVKGSNSKQAGKQQAGKKAGVKTKSQQKQADDDEEEDNEEIGGEGEEGQVGEEQPEGPRILGQSRKEGRTRRRELISGGKTGLAHQLCKACRESGADYLRHPVSCDLIVEVCRGGQDGLLASVCPDGVSSVHEAIVQEVSQPQDGQAGTAAGPALPHVLLDYYGSRALRRLVLHGADVPAADGATKNDGDSSKYLVGSGKHTEVEGEGEGTHDTAISFVDLLWSKAFKGKCKSWFGTHADKVLSAFVFARNAEVRVAAVKELKGLVKGDVAKWAEAFVRGDVVKSKGS